MSWYDGKKTRPNRNAGGRKVSSKASERLIQNMDRVRRQQGAQPISLPNLKASEAKTAAVNAINASAAKYYTADPSKTAPHPSVVRLAKAQEASERREQARRIKSQSGSALNPSNAPAITPSGGRLVDTSKGGRGTGGDLTVKMTVKKFDAIKGMSAQEASERKEQARRLKSQSGSALNPSNAPAITPSGGRLVDTSKGGRGTGGDLTVKGLTNLSLEQQAAARSAKFAAMHRKMVFAAKQQGGAQPGSYESGLGSGSRRDLSLEEEAAAKGTKFGGSGGGGGKGRGNWGHKGRPGKRGGSA